MSWLAALALLAQTASPDVEEPLLQGHWQGAVVREGALLPLSLRFDTTEDPSLAEMDVPSYGIFGDLAPVPRDGRDLDLAFGPFRLQLAFDDERGRLHGDLVDARNLVRGSVELLRVARPPLPRVVHEPVLFPSGEGDDVVELAGQLVLPEGPGPHPGIVIVQGRGYGPGAENRSLAVACARRGLAALTFDGRGTGGSGGRRGGHTLANRLDDAEAALLTLLDDPRVDADRVGLMGHSAGGWVVPVVAERTGAVAFLVLQVGPGVSLADQQGQVVRALARRTGRFDEQELDAAYAYQRELVALTVAGAAWSAIEAHVASASGQSWASHVDRPAHAGDAELDYFRRCPHDSVSALRATTIPLLALYGGEDYVVPPEDNGPALEAHLRAAGNTDFRIVVYPGAGHDLMLPGSEDPFRWARRPPGYFDTLLDWIFERVE